jgi:hypothetical protein
MNAAVVSEFECSLLSVITSPLSSMTQIELSLSPTWVFIAALLASDQLGDPPGSQEYRRR